MVMGMGTTHTCFLHSPNTIKASPSLLEERRENDSGGLRHGVVGSSLYAYAILLCSFSIAWHICLPGLLHFCYACFCLCNSNKSTVTWTVCRGMPAVLHSAYHACYSYICKHDITAALSRHCCCLAALPAVSFVAAVAVKGISGVPGHGGAWLVCNSMPAVPAAAAWASGAAKHHCSLRRWSNKLIYIYTWKRRWGGEVGAGRQWRQWLAGRQWPAATPCIAVAQPCLSSVSMSNL